MKIKKGVEKAVKRNAARFFTPGHRGESFLPLYYDVTEIKGTDNLHSPAGIINAAAKTAAKTFGAKNSFFLVNGSSVGIHALIMSVCSRGDTLIVDRGCHISVINALILNDIRPIYIYPEYNEEFGILTSISPANVVSAFKKHPHAKGVLITSPNYYGICCDVEGIACAAHNFNAVLLVDEAHGAHFAFSSALPKTALSCGADGVVQSAHKTLPCITQGALLHLGGGKINMGRVLENLSMLQTTSPSYLIMMSIERSISKACAYPRERINEFIKRCFLFRERINKTGKFKCLDNNDATRLIVNAGKNANKANLALRQRYNIISELCDGQNIIFIAKIFYDSKDIKRLETALIEIGDGFPPHRAVNNLQIPKLRLKMPPAKAYFCKTEIVSPQKAIGKIAARAVYQTPPCMSIITPGEIITEDAVLCLKDDVTVVMHKR